VVSLTAQCLIKY